MRAASLMITIDGSQGEGGGQILRSSLALSLVTGKPFRITRIRASRKKPGLMRQHLTAVHAARQVGRAEVRGAELGSMELTFVPGDVTPGDYHFATGTAGSATLVFQTVLPALLRASSPSRLTLEGGTHNPFAPPFDFLARTFAPVVNQIGPRIETRLIRPGFYPAGGGELSVSVEPADAWQQLELLDRGKLLRRVARAVVARLPRKIAERELRVIQAGLGWDAKDLAVEEAAESRGPGNVVLIEVECEHVTEVLTSFGSRGVPAEAVANDAVDQARRYLQSDAPVGEHLADQLLIPLALAGGGAFRTISLSRHTTTNLQVMKTFLELNVETTQLKSGDWLMKIC
jgi:RNA 3'-terminal phosphate cyclase (ATP)